MPDKYLEGGLEICEKLLQVGGDEGGMVNKCNELSWVGSWNRKKT